RDITPGEACDDCAVRERQLALAVCLDRYIVAEKGAKIVEITFFVGHRDQLPVAVSGRNCDSENRISLSIGASSGGGRVGDNAGDRCNCNQREHDPFHSVLQICHVLSSYAVWELSRSCNESPH